MREGERIDGITLWLFGGVARLRGQPDSPGAEFRTAAAGPAVTVVLVAVFWLVALGPAGRLAGRGPGLFDYLARINLLVLGFNLVPALPLDGGRVLRAWLWRRQRSFVAATRSAARAGQAFGILLVAIGLLGLFTGGGLGGIWFAFLGWLLLQAAQAEAIRTLARQALGDRRVRDLMSPEPVAVAPDRRPVRRGDRRQPPVLQLPGGRSGAGRGGLAGRGGGRQTIGLETRQLPALAGGAGIGVQVETRDLQVDLPFEVRFTERPELAGPSAGLAYALALADLLDQVDYAGGRTVAATSTMEADGDVGLVGGVEQKALAAERDGAELFLVPSAEVDQARDADLRVRGSAAWNRLWTCCPLRPEPRRSHRERSA